MAHAADTVNRRIRRLHEQRPAPSLWGMTVNDLGHLTVRGHDIVSLAASCGTPLHAVDGDRLTQTLTAFEAGFRRHYPHVVVAYSYKTNPLPGVLRHLHARGAWAEVISHFELWLALRLGVPPERIVFNGPAKTQQALELAVSRNIAVINIDGPDEIETIDKLAARYGVTQTVGMRVITSVGWSEQFGFSISTGAAEEAARRISGCPHVVFRGLHLHLGTGISNIATYVTGIRDVMSFAGHLRQRFGVRLKYLDFGGGFAVPTVGKFTALDEVLLHHRLPASPPALDGVSMVERHASAIVAAVRGGLAGDAGEEPTLVFEPGRAVTSSAQTLVLSVIARKDRAGTVPVLIVDGGRNLAMPPSWEYHALLPVNRAGESGARYYDVFGPLCHPGELLFRARWLPEIQAGDLLAIMDAGAYFIPNQTNFSNPRPAAVMIRGDEYEIIRARESFEDVVRLDQC